MCKISIISVLIFVMIVMNIGSNILIVNIGGGRSFTI